MQLALGRSWSFVLRIVRWSLLNNLKQYFVASLSYRLLCIARKKAPFGQAKREDLAKMLELIIRAAFRGRPLLYPIRGNEIVHKKTTNFMLLSC